jgi:hypothetical protein
MIRHSVKIGFRDVDAFGKRTLMADDPHNGARGAVVQQTAAAKFARSTRTINLPDDSATGKFPGASDPDELMPERALKTHVAVAQLQIGLADARFGDVDNDFIFSGVSECRQICEVQAIRKNDSLHVPVFLSAVSGFLQAMDSSRSITFVSV